MKRLVLVVLLLSVAASAQVGAHRYWRLNFFDAGDNALSVVEWKFFDSVGAQIATTGGTASGTSQCSGSTLYAYAFDGNTSTAWCGAHPTFASPSYVQYAFASAVNPASYSLTVNATGSFMNPPGSWALQWSDNGTTFTTVGYYSYQFGQVSGETQSFPINGTNGMGKAYRLLITANNLGTGVGTRELKLYDTVGSLISKTGTAVIPIDSCCGTANLKNLGSYSWDGSASTGWVTTASPSVGSPKWVVVALPSSASPTVCSFSVQAANVLNQSVTAFTVESSPSFAASSWTTLGTYSVATWADTSDVKQFAVSDPACTVRKRVGVSQ